MADLRRFTALAVSFSLNLRQIEAIEHVHGPMLVVAGAGTGKTTVLVRRIVRLVREAFAKPSEILALTFTDNAAAEMAQRVRDGLGASQAVRATTFHTYCMELLRQHGRAFKVVDKQDLWIYLRRRMRELPLHYYSPARDPGEFLDALLGFFERCHDELVDPAAFSDWVRRLASGEAALPRVAKSKKLADIPREEQIERWQEIAAIYSAVEAMLARDNLGTFGHMISRAIDLLRSDPSTLTQVQSQARFLLIDEFQDVNIAQIVLAELLAGSERNVFAVGDPDQAIYRFRGASAAAFQEFATRFPETLSVVLKENQRSHTPILKCAYSSISCNPAVHCIVDNSGKRFEREALVSARDEKLKAREQARLPRVEIVLHTSPSCEAADVADAIEHLCKTPRSDPRHMRFAVLYRSHAHRTELVRELADRNIPHAVTGLNALETTEIRDLLACLRVIGEGESGSLFRMAALPVFHVDAKRLRELMSSAPQGTEFASLLAKAPGGNEVLAAVEGAREFAEQSEFDVSKIVHHVLRRFALDRGAPAIAAFIGFLEKWREKPIVSSPTLAEFLQYMKWFPAAAGSIEVPAGADANDPEVVQLMTVHAAKGLEFDHVFVIRLDQGSFPWNYKEPLFEFPTELRKGVIPDADPKDIHKDEERRLFYVAMTRARDSLTVITKPGRGRDKRPIAFVGELLKDSKTSDFRQERPPSITLEISAAAAPLPTSTGVAQWLLRPPPDKAITKSLSASSVERYEACPLQFKIYRDWKLPGEIAASMQFGQVMHTVLRDYVESIRAGRPKAPEQVIDCLKECLQATWFEEKLQRDLYQEEGTGQLREFVRVWQSGEPPDVIYTEQNFTFEVEGLRVSGRIDRIDRIQGERVTIVDYKTGTPRPRQDADHSLQLSLYALAAREKWGFIPERLVFYNLKDNSTAETSRTSDDLAEEIERVRKVAEGINEGNFDPTPGYHCRRCNFRQLCPYTEERVYVIQRAEQAAGVSG
jgi:DNA helicase-2/ATP-dependent DNA helicase PcrA